MRLRRTTKARRATGAVVLVTSGALAASAMGGSELPDNKYEGRAEGDNTTYVGFNVKKKNGERRVKAVSAFLRYNCQGGGGGSAFARAQGRIKVDDEGRFEGTVRTDDVPARGSLARGGPTGTTYVFKGRLKQGGRAKGRIDANIVFAGGVRGEPSERCYTGELDWRARRGAEVAPIFAP